jgi:hypothetical protein
MHNTTDPFHILIHLRISRHQIWLLQPLYLKPVFIKHIKPKGTRGCKYVVSYLQEKITNRIIFNFLG